MMRFTLTPKSCPGSAARAAGPPLSATASTARRTALRTIVPGTLVRRHRSARRSDAPEPVRHIAMKTSTAMSRPVCGRLEVLDELDGFEVLPEPLLPDVPAEVPVLLLPPELLDASTVTVPVIEGWIVQMYGNVPAVVKVCEPLLFLLIVPVSKLLSLAVAVWGAMSWFVQVIVSPTCTLEVLGLNWKFLIVTPDEAAAVTVAGFCALEPELVAWRVWRRRLGGTSAGAAVERADALAAPWPCPVDVPASSVTVGSTLGGFTTFRSSLAAELWPWSSRTRTWTVSGPARFGVSWAVVRSALSFSKLPLPSRSHA